MSPALPPACSSASFAPLTRSAVDAREAPCSGTDEYTVTLLLLLPLLPLLPELPPLLSSLLPHAVTPSANAAARQPVAAMNFDCKEPLLMRLVFGRRFYSRPGQACQNPEGGSAEVRGGAHPKVGAPGGRVSRRGRRGRPAGRA